MRDRERERVTAVKEGANKRKRVRESATEGQCGFICSAAEVRS